MVDLVILAEEKGTTQQQPPPQLSQQDDTTNIETGIFPCNNNKKRNNQTSNSSVRIRIYYGLIVGVVILVVVIGISITIGGNNRNQTTNNNNDLENSGIDCFSSCPGSGMVAGAGADADAGTDFSTGSNIGYSTGTGGNEDVEDAGGVLDGSSANTDSNIISSCQNGNSQQQIFQVNDDDSSSSLLTISQPDTISILWLVDTTNCKIQKPIARSYDGNIWESYNHHAPGGGGGGDNDFSFSKISFDCDNNDGSGGTTSSCQIHNLPKNPPPGMFYVIHTKQYPSTTTATIPSSSASSRRRQDIAARFLEQATFGPQWEEIETLAGESSSSTTTTPSSSSSLLSPIAQWIQTQMGLVLPQQQSSVSLVSSHRQLVRQHLNHRLQTPNSQAIPTHPCQAGTRYRRMALSDKDRDKKLKLSTDPTTGRRILSIQNQIRTVLDYTQIELYADLEEEDEDTDSIPLWQRKYFNGIYEILKCRPQRVTSNTGTNPSGISLVLTLYHPTLEGCYNVITKTGENVLLPMVYFDDDTLPTNPTTVTLNDNNAREIDDQYYSTTTRLDDNNIPMSLILEHDLYNDDENVDACRVFPTITGNTFPQYYVVVGWYQNHPYIHDSRYSLLENTIEHPTTDGGGKRYQATQNNERRNTQCSNVQRNFLNEEFCYYSEDPNVCDAAGSGRNNNNNGVGSDNNNGDAETISVLLTVENLQRIYQLTSRIPTNNGGTPRYLYAVTGLRQSKNDVPYNPPCTPSTRSRWILMEDDLESSSCNSNSNNIGGSMTTAIFRQLLTTAESLQSINNQNPNIRDVFFPATGFECDAQDMERFDFYVPVQQQNNNNINNQESTQCWKNVHQDEFQVYDFTPWINTGHPGGPEVLQAFAIEKETFHLEFPTWHEMSRWHIDGLPFRSSIGRLGDIARVRLPTELADDVDVDVNLELEQITSNNNNSGENYIPSSGLVCGSPNEVANDLSLGGSIQQGAFDANTRVDRTTSSKVLDQQKLSTWMHIALNGKDQLRQRVAWILSQLLVVSPLAISGSNGSTELFVSYYDIFVRHAFGNYRDVLREVSYSPIMAEMLSYLGSKSTNYVWRTNNRLEYADENYAREIMQLFTIGLYELHNNGTKVIDETTATTGGGGPIRTYTNDDITEYARLWTGFQKQFGRGNIESRSAEILSNTIDPMRINLQARDSLPKLGLKQWYVGDGLPLCIDLPHQHFLKRGATYRLLGTVSTPQLLNEPQGWATNTAVRRLQIETTSKLYQKLCDTSVSSSSSCQWVSMLTLDEDLACTGIECNIDAPRVVEMANTGIYYEYARVPCSHLSFFEGIVMRPSQQGNPGLYCENPQTPEGGLTSCCAGGRGDGQRVQQFWGERLTFVAAQRQCADQGLQVCLNVPSDCLETNSCDSSIGYWTRVPCQGQVKIDLEGNVAVVHSGLTDNFNKQWIHPNVREDTKTHFRVVWDGPIDDVLADYESKCAALGCSRDFSDNLCLCPATVTEEQALFSSNPTREEVLALPIGAFPPEMYDSNLSVNLDLGDGIKMHSSNGQLSSESVFEVLENGIKQFRKNIRSIVSVGTNQALPISFRNPPHIISLTNPELRDAHYETGVGLDHYFYHPNTAPFLAIRFAQRFGISNPSPRYVDVMATAFRSGIYKESESGIVFGSAIYGDLSALVAAALLDREARSAVLDADPTHGSILEPFLKFLRLMRSLEFQPDDDKPFVEFATSLQDQIGQEPYQMNSVFSFFLPEYQPSGPLGSADLFCPECQVLTGPKIIALMNGMLSLVKYGLDSAYGGLGEGRGWRDESLRSLGDYSLATGANTYVPTNPSDAGQVIDELATLLTSGRLDGRKREYLHELYKTAVEDDGVDNAEALIYLQQLIITTPEFHANGLSSNTEGPREEPETPEASETPYKAVIYLMLEGGYDSFNMLVPHICSGTNEAGRTLDEQYISERGEIAFTKQERTLQIEAQNQPCSTFVLHDELTILKDLYDDGDLSFIANAGVIASADGMSKSNYNTKTPIQLFAHNGMQLETKTVDPLSQAPGTGVLGRLAEVLSEKGFKTNSITVDDPSVTVTSAAGSNTPEPVILSRFGVETFNPQPVTEAVLDEYIVELNAASTGESSLFGEKWSKDFSSGIQQAEFLKAALDSASLGNFWSEDEDQSDLVQKMAVVSKMIQTHNLRGTDRDFFYTSYGSWDHHAQVKTKLRSMFSDLNESLQLLVTELKRQNSWDDVVIVVTSEFGRTITPNSGGGSDHAWGGHYFMMGGAVNGGNILGEYPRDITPTGPLNLGRGRILPTTSWDAIWNGVSEWMGAETDRELDYCLPNRWQATTGPGFTKLFSEGDLFRHNNRRLGRHSNAA